MSLIDNLRTREVPDWHDRLAALSKIFEIKIFPDKGHGLDMQEVFINSLDFFKHKLMADTPKR